MIPFQKFFKIYESVTGELTPDTTFEELSKMGTIRTYRSSAKNDKTSYQSGSHVGSKLQALIRADYMLNDEEKYDEYYLYEVILDVGKIYPKVHADDGSDHDISYGIDVSNDYDLIAYKNTGEGDIRRENLSLIILNPSNVISNKIVKTLTPEYLLSIQRELY